MIPKFLDVIRRSVPNLECDLDDPVEGRILSEYGAVFVARNGAVPPDRLIFRDAGEVETFQGELSTRTGAIGEFEVELQTPAMDALLAAIDEAKAAGLEITPRGADSARRGYDQTVELWLSRVLPALDHWTANGRLKGSAAEEIRELSPFEQVSKVLELEEQGIYFAKDLSKSIMYSVAPPGTSQHLSLLAIDIAQFHDVAVREILSRHGWFQTVVSDLPHFTYLGAATDELATFGLKEVRNGDRVFWIPDL